MTSQRSYSGDAASLQICHCPCCRDGIEAPHEYHLERRLMPQAWALTLSALLVKGDTKELKAANDLLGAKCRREQMSRTAVLMEWGDPREWDAALGVKGPEHG
jgi:hypothetical protein